MIQKKFSYFSHIVKPFCFVTLPLFFNTYRCDGTVISIREDNSSSFQSLYAKAYGSSYFRPPRDAHNKIGKGRI